MTVDLSKVTVTQQQINLMKHTLGLDNAKTAYRNRYATLVSDTAEWDDLVEKELAEKGVVAGLMAYYHVSKTGKQFLKSIGIEGVGVTVWEAVRVRNDLEVNEFYDGHRFHAGMAKHKGKSTFVSSISHLDANLVHVACDNEGYFWTSSMLEEVSQ
ncbi:hypothetical protein HCB21_02945 [Listeria booriae]|uniref:hypothetical protein n=1 Tax=Listeria booriae TaxID=1552123 RepID=UPI001628FD3D|nr:hypothetical protein [Listeria booriae]MBC1229776.1 hypothetical protein [Listeria booriae]MBC1233125.1 hypothetical protein [Listeria booriae]MBC2158712.1 hypothetical protein [Listeria booriae]